MSDRLGRGKATSKVIRRESERLIDRLHYCRSMLFIHGGISQVENRKCRGRLAKIGLAKITGSTP